VWSAPISSQSSANSLEFNELALIWFTIFQLRSARCWVWSIFFAARDLCEYAMCWFACWQLTWSAQQHLNDACQCAAPSNRHHTILEFQLTFVNDIVINGIEHLVTCCFGWQREEKTILHSNHPRARSAHIGLPFTIALLATSVDSSAVKPGAGGSVCDATCGSWRLSLSASSTSLACQTVAHCCNFSLHLPTCCGPATMARGPAPVADHHFENRCYSNFTFGTVDL